MVMHVSASDFEEEVLKEKGVVVVDFWATWCGPCKMIAPIVEELDEEMSNVKFVKVDVDKNPQIANQYKIVSIPTLKIFKDGKLINTLIGFKTKDALKIDVEACL
ncbi:MAG: thioredoxin [Sarcina ventriculi]|uniref:Thioredoxin n=2 Tax=Sarcina TaxID=1266 RepID=A0ACD1BF82_9CLOT|nr:MULTISPECIES: thioredoxin [Sarcina]MDO4401347.1 thioredoxin [Clostridiaceae bacterium]MBU5323188.1 thioredoxin [Sarcina ventriculi]MCI5636107.1 thioredoxin [Sarcina ventriculi]MDD7372346.1 thioredoxin [Sarcina ventriculi]MDY7061446.1 thioredoxin [Sarcina ventriculi]